MDTQLRHDYLGIATEPIGKSRARVISSLIIIAITTVMMLSQDFQLIRHHDRVRISKLKSRTIRKVKSLIE